ncbi:MAG: hypothetical protein ACLP1E_08770 [Acidimicrobiales bacterium]
MSELRDKLHDAHEAIRAALDEADGKGTPSYLRWILTEVERQFDLHFPEVEAEAKKEAETAVAAAEPVIEAAVPEIAPIVPEVAAEVDKLIEDIPNVGEPEAAPAEPEAVAAEPFTATVSTSIATEPVPDI